MIGVGGEGERFADWPDLDGGWLFGSVARGDADREFDVDVLLVSTDLGSPNFHGRVALLQSGVKAWTGNDLQLVEHTPATWHRLKVAENPLVEQIRIDGIALARNDPRLLERLK